MRLVSYQPDIAPNLGALIRISACFGVALDIIEPCGFPFSVKALRRSAMDYADLADLRRHDSWAAYLAANSEGRLVLLTTSATTGLWDFSFRSDDRLLLGRETAGVPPEVEADCDQRLRIPMPGGGRSLNVAVAGGIALAEAMRQTGRGAAS